MEQTLQKPVKMTRRLASKIYREAHEAGLAAGKAVGVQPIIVGEETSLFSNQIDYTKPTYVMDGLCGFAWVVIRPARGLFVKHLKESGLGHANYGGGWAVWVSDFNQSMHRKEAYAVAFASVLNSYGINAYVESRLD